MSKIPTQYLFEGNVIADIEHVTGGYIWTDEGRIFITDEVQMKIIHGNETYWVECYYTGDYEGDYNSDTYAIRVYDTHESFKNHKDNEHEIAEMYVFSDGSSITDEGLYLKDTKVENAIMGTLFGREDLGIEGLIKPF